MVSIEPTHQAASKAEVASDQTEDHTIETQPAQQTQPTATDSENKATTAQNKDDSNINAYKAHYRETMKLLNAFHDMVKEVSGDPTLATLDDQTWNAFCEQAKTDSEKARAVRFIDEALEHVKKELEHMKLRQPLGYVNWLEDWYPGPEPE